MRIKSGLYQISSGYLRVSHYCFLALAVAGLLGTALGFVTSFAACFLPSGLGANESWLDMTITHSFYGSALPVLDNLSSQGNGTLSVLPVLGVIMPVAGGAFGVRPRLGCTPGAAEILVETLGMYLVASSQGLAIASYDVGFWVLWAGAAGTLAAFFWVWWDKSGRGENMPSGGRSE